MINTIVGRLEAIAKRVSRSFALSAFVALIPTALLVLNHLFGEAPLMIAAMISPLAVFCFWVAFEKNTAPPTSLTQPVGILPPNAFEASVEGVIKKVAADGQNSAFYAIEIDNHENLVELYGNSGCQSLSNTLGTRLVSALRNGDLVTRTNLWSFSVCPTPSKAFDLEVSLQVANRLQTILEDPVAVDGATVYVTACVGFSICASDKAASVDKLKESAEIALTHARRHGPGTLRAFSEKMRKTPHTRSEHEHAVQTALATGEIIPWFQPQISTDTGQVTGFEALARWNHPTDGIVPPSEFLHAIENADLFERLMEIMVYQSLQALTSWDKAGADIPQVGVNFAGTELNNPALADKIAWEIDRFGLEPNRLAIEVLETVMSRSPDDVVTRNIKKLSDMGCSIDLDDFGTGNASIAFIRRFAVDRIKIDRSFVAKCDRDPEQQRVTTAILTMAEHLGLETLAEGVETVGEHAFLAQLGCGHVQGFGIARPMPFAQTLDWIAAHNQKLQSTQFLMDKKFRRP